VLNKINEILLNEELDLLLVNTDLANGISNRVTGYESVLITGVL